MDSDATKPEPHSTEWADQFNFWHKIISSEVDRLRFNDGLEPIDIDLYRAPKKYKADPDYLGESRIGSNLFQAMAFYCRDAQGKEVLRIQIRSAS